MTPFDRAQENYDAQEHPDYWTDVHEPCDEDEPEHMTFQECLHAWKQRNIKEQP